jgi:hypothetical protein
MSAHSIGDSESAWLDALASLTPEELAALPPDELFAASLLLERERPLRFREFLESSEYCGLSLSPMVAAIVDASEGVYPETIDDATAERYFGCDRAELPRRLLREVALQAGGRGGKTSRLLAPKALHAAWTTPLPTLAHGEHAVALIVSSEVVFAKQALSFCAGYVDQSPRLKAALVGVPTTESLTLRRPDGKLVDIRVRAAGAKGKGGRAFTLVFAGLDEACFFFDDSGVVNDREIYRAVAQRVVPGGQVWMVSTPWVQGVGLLEEKLADHWGHHDGTLAVRGVGTRALNPSWDPDGEIEKELRKDPDNAEREIDAKPLAGGSRYFFSHDAIEAAFNDDIPQQTPYRVGTSYTAGGDTGFRRNSSALAVVGCEYGEGSRQMHLARLEERKPSPGLPLQPEAVARDFGDVVLAYHAREIVVDSHERTKVADALEGKGVGAVDAPSPDEAFTEARNVLHEGRIRLPANPRLKQQLRSVMSRPMPGGGTQIVIPKSPDGSHGDLAVALVRAIWRAESGDPDAQQVSRSGRRR